DICEFVGGVSHQDVLDRMREADIALVPSHHDYPEGLPMTICESLIVHTPIVVSDHPMFQGKIVDRKSGLVVREKSPKQIAEAVKRYMNDRLLYESVSSQSPAAWSALQLPLHWHALLERWLSGSAEDIEYLKSYSLASGQYV